MFARMKSLTFPLLLSTVLIVMVAPVAQGRTWTDRTGKHTIEAEYRGVVNDTVYLTKANGETVRVPLMSLCEADIQYIRRSMAERANTTGPSTTRPTPTPPATSASPSWPRWHGPDSTNVSSETGLLKQWPDGGPRMIWQAENIGQGYASVTIAGGTIYTTGNLDGKTMMTAMDLDGNKKWTADCGPAYTGSFPATRGTPTVDGDRIYNESPNGDLVCLNAKTGDKIWSRNILQEFGGQRITWALAESVLIDGKNVICCPGGNQAVVAALDKMTGRTVWTTPGIGDQAGYCSPVLAEQNGLRMILTMTSNSLIGVNADTGQLLFKQPHETKYKVNATDPIYHNGMVFVSSGYGTTGSKMYRVNVTGKQASVREAWACRDLDNKHGGVLRYQGHLYGSGDANGRQQWMCLDWNTGEIKWREQGVRMGSLTCADGMLFMLGEKGGVALVRATPDRYQETGRFQAPSGGNDPHWAHPVVCGGRLYIRHAQKLFVYDVKQ